MKLTASCPIGSIPKPFIMRQCVELISELAWVSGALYWSNPSARHYCALDFGMHMQPTTMRGSSTRLNRNMLSKIDFAVTETNPSTNPRQVWTLFSEVAQRRIQAMAVMYLGPFLTVFAKLLRFQNSRLQKSSLRATASSTRYKPPGFVKVLQASSRSHRRHSSGTVCSRRRRRRRHADIQFGCLSPHALARSMKRQPSVEVLYMVVFGSLGCSRPFRNTRGSLEKKAVWGPVPQLHDGHLFRR